MPLMLWAWRSPVIIGTIDSYDMIGYLKGRIIHTEDDGILLLAGHIGYEILLSAQMLEKILQKPEFEEETALYIYYHQTERQPKPVLIGFESLEDKAFFQLFITVAAVGPMKAVKAMTRPTSEIAQAIERKDVSFLSGLNGIGKRTAEKIIATLHGKAARFAGSLPSDQEGQDQATVSEALLSIMAQVEDVLVEQLGHSQGSARRMIAEALEKNPGITEAEGLFDAVFKEG